MNALANVHMITLEKVLHLPAWPVVDVMFLPRASMMPAGAYTRGSQATKTEPKLKKCK